MKTRVRRWTSLALCSILGGALSFVVVAGSGSGAGATPVALSVSPTSLSFGEATLGNFLGPMTFTMTNSSVTSDTVTFNYTGTGAHDYFPAFKDCTSNPAGTVVTLAGGGSCTVDMYFIPGALGARPATLSLSDTANSDAVVALDGTGGIGYYQVDSQGAVAYAGNAAYYGDASDITLNHPIVGMAPTGNDGGYWLVASDGGVFNFGDAPFDGSAGALPLNKPIVGMASTHNTIGPTGYWLVASDGGIFSYGQAPFYGSTGSMHLNEPIVGMAATPDGGGYWLVASDGGIFAYGDAQFYGSTGGMHINKPIVGMASTPDGGGYWLVASDGGIFAYGDALFYGSTGSIQLAQPIAGMAPMPDGAGYWFSAADGGLFNYGDAPFYGSGTGIGLGQVVGMATDGVPTGQAATDSPAIRPKFEGSTTGSGSARPRYFS
jgi:hypothetical protein